MLNGGLLFNSIVRAWVFGFETNPTVDVQHSDGCYRANKFNVGLNTIPAIYTRKTFHLLDGVPKIYGLSIYSGSLEESITNHKKDLVETEWL